MKRLTLLSISVLAAVSLAAWVFTGCEKEPSTNVISDTEDYFNDHPFPPGDVPITDTDLDITPDSASVVFLGQTFTFHARGGTPPYDWSVANDDYGSVDVIAANTETANYTVKVLAPNAVVVTDNSGHAAQATIQAVFNTTLKIIPASTSFSTPTNSTAPYWFDNERINFAVVGGIPPYTQWHVTLPSLGGMVSYAANIATNTYVVNGNGLGSNIVWIADNAGTVAQATVITVKSGGL